MDWLYIFILFNPYLLNTAYEDLKVKKIKRLAAEVVATAAAAEGDCQLEFNKANNSGNQMQY